MAVTPLTHPASLGLRRTATDGWGSLFVPISPAPPPKTGGHALDARPTGAPSRPGGPATHKLETGNHDKSPTLLGALKRPAASLAPYSETWSVTSRAIGRMRERIGPIADRRNGEDWTGKCGPWGLSQPPRGRRLELHQNCALTPEPRPVAYFALLHDAGWAEVGHRRWREWWQRRMGRRQGRAQLGRRFVLSTHVISLARQSYQTGRYRQPKNEDRHRCSQRALLGPQATRIV